jgi:hypothetical protein
MVTSLLLTLALIAPAHLTAQTPSPTAPTPPPKPTQAKPAPKGARTPAAPTVVLTISVTSLSGEALEGVNVTALGPVEREAVTIANGTVRLPGLRPGTYRLRFEHEGFHTFEKEVSWRSGQPAPLEVALTPAPPPPPPPEPPPSTKPAGEMTLPPPSTPKTMTLPDYIERNFIGPREPQREDLVGCSGVAQAVVWQVRDPWTDREHPSADVMLYVIGGEGSVQMDGRDTSLGAGSFAVVPRGTTYTLSRRGRNPLIILSFLGGAPCAAD